VTSAQIFSSILATILAIIIYWLVRRDHLAPNQALRWILVAIVILVLGFFPSLVDQFGAMIGISYPPIIPIIVAIGAAIVKVMFMDIQLNKAKVTQERMIQKIAMLEADLNMLNNKLNAHQNDHSGKVDKE
jgi:hypothetical protein